MQHGRRGYPAFSDSANDRENGVQQEGSSGPHRRIEAPYRDEPTEDAGTRTQEQGSDHATAQGRDGSMTVQPSSLQGHENEWRD